MADLLCLIPARGGSKTVRRKNLRTVGGKTLVQLAVEACRPHGRVVVSTDDVDIAAVARMCGAEVEARPLVLAADGASIDDLVRHTRRSYGGALLVFQPTVPQAAAHLTGFISFAKHFDEGCSMAVRRRHIVWLNEDTPLTVRGQRQGHPGLLDEIGVRYYPPGLIMLGRVWECPEPLRDIDTPEDLDSVRRVRRRIQFRAVCNPSVGSGHVRRCVQIADELQHHDIMFTPVHSDPTLFASLAGGYPIVTDDMPCDLIVNDMLDTTEEQMFELRFRAPVVALEDIGPGAQHASLLVNELYPAHAPGELSGPKWAVLRPVFTAAPEHKFGHSGPSRLLVTFGGTDPAGLTVRLRRIVGSLDADSVIVDPPSRGGGADIASLLAWADLVVCSGGRTVWEAMATGTPAVVLCQNSRELSHSHLSPLYGVLNLGLGALVSDVKIDETVRFLLQATGFLADMSGQMRGVVDGRGALRIAHRIEGLLGGL